MQKATAVIVAKGQSKRLERKNLLEIDGKTLVARKINQLKACQHIQQIIVGSDDPQIMREAEIHGALAVLRESYYCDESAISANQMIENMCHLIQADLVLWAHCTNPLVSSNTYDNAIETYHQVIQKGYDSLVSVAMIREHMWAANKKPMNYDPYAASHVAASDLEPMYVQDGAIFIQPYKQMSANHYFFGDHPYLYTMPAHEVLDINTQHDYDLAKAYIECRNKP